MKLSQHASTRVQQRGIPPMVIDLLLRFGARERDGHGAETVYFDKRSRKQIQTYAGGLMGKLSEALDTYAVVNGEKVITVGSRYKRLNRT